MKEEIKKYLSLALLHIIAYTSPVITKYATSVMAKSYNVLPYYMWSIVLYVGFGIVFTWCICFFDRASKSSSAILLTVLAIDIVIAVLQLNGTFNFPFSPLLLILIGVMASLSVMTVINKKKIKDNKGGDHGFTPGTDV